MAVIAAALSGRCDSMVSALEERGMQPIVIEDLVTFRRRIAAKRVGKPAAKRGASRKAPWTPRETAPSTHSAPAAS